LDLGRIVDRLGKQYGIRLVAISPNYGSLSQISQSTEDVNELPITLEFKGRFSGVSRFLDNIHELPYVLRINETVIEKAEEGGSLLKIEFRGVIVLRKERADDYALTKDNVTNRT
jgi:Tfp pilus assembly protein PilO